jgi:hypothetical protein
MDYVQIYKKATKYALTEMKLPPLVYEYRFQPGEETFLLASAIDDVQKKLTSIKNIPKDSIKVDIDYVKPRSSTIKKLKIKSVKIIFEDQAASAPLSSMTPEQFQLILLPLLNPKLREKMTQVLKDAQRRVAAAGVKMRNVQDIAAQLDASEKKKKKKKKNKKKSGSGAVEAAEAEAEAEAIIAEVFAIQQQQQQDDQAIIRRYAPILKMQQQVFRPRYHDLLARVYQAANTSGIPLNEARRIFLLAMNHRIPSGYIKIISYGQQQQQQQSRKRLVNFPLIARWETPSSAMMENFIEDVEESVSPETFHRLRFRQMFPERRPFAYDYLYGS